MLAITATGKGRKERCPTLTQETVAVLREWLNERQGEPDDPLFPTRRGTHPSTDAIVSLVAKHAATAAHGCPSLKTKHVTPHVLRHTNAMLLLNANIDILTIALWLGHESTKSTEIYLHADPTTKERAIQRTAPLNTKPGRYRPSDTLLAFLEGL